MCVRGGWQGQQNEEGGVKARDEEQMYLHLF